MGVVRVFNYCRGPVVVHAIGYDYFYFVTVAQEGEVFHAVVHVHAGGGGFEIHYSGGGVGDGGDVEAAVCFDDDFVAGVGEVCGEGGGGGLEEGFAAGDEGEGCVEGVDGGEDHGDGEGAAGGGAGVLGVAPGAGEVAVCESDEGAGDSGSGGFALDGVEDFDDVECIVVHSLSGFSKRNT